MRFYYVPSPKCGVISVGYLNHDVYILVKPILAYLYCLNDHSFQDASSVIGADAALFTIVYVIRDDRQLPVWIVCRV